MSFIDTITQKVSGGGTASIDPQKAVDTIATAAFTQGLIAFAQGIAVIAIIGAIIWYFYLRFKIYNIAVRVWATGANGSIMVGEDRGRINPSTNDMRLWSKNVNLQIPDRKYYVQTEKGGWLINIEKFGAKDYTFCTPSVDETGVIL